jgi:hypothetical protein
LLIGRAEGEPMLRNLKELERYTVCATDGDVGKVVNFLFDDERWAIRYLVVETGGFFLERRVLISPISFREVRLSAERFHLDLTRDKVKNSPGVDTDPTSLAPARARLLPLLWLSILLGLHGGMGCRVLSRRATRRAFGREPAGFHPPRVGRRSPAERTNAVEGYGVHGSDDGIGFVKDFIVDDETWEVRYLVVDISH